jgi:tetratricopeptide (TPR) repeat protein
LLPRCRALRDPFERRARTLALQALARAGSVADARGEGAAFATLVERAASAQPSADLSLILARYYIDHGDLQAALRSVKLAQAEAGPDEGGQWSLVELERALKRLRDTIAAASSAPDDPALHVDLAQQWMAQGQSERALRAYQAALRHMAGDYRIRREVALLLVRHGTLADAREGALEAYARAPSAEHAFWREFIAALDAATDHRAADLHRHMRLLAHLAVPDDQAAWMAFQTLQTMPWE